jgi:hypothetical protein
MHMLHIEFLEILAASVEAMESCDFLIAGVDLFLSPGERSLGRRLPRLSSLSHRLQLVAPLVRLSQLVRPSFVVKLGLLGVVARWLSPEVYFILVLEGLVVDEVAEFVGEGLEGGGELQLLALVPHQVRLRPLPHVPSQPSHHLVLARQVESGLDLLLAASHFSQLLFLLSDLDVLLID